MPYRVQSSLDGNTIAESFISSGHIDKLTITLGGASGIVTETELRELYNDYTNPYTETGITSVALTDRFYTILDNFSKRRTETTYDYFMLEVFKDLLLILQSAKSSTLTLLVRDIENETLRAKITQLESDLQTVRNELANCMNEYEGAVAGFSGTASIQVHSFKPLIYSLAVLDLRRAWYYFLHGKPPTGQALDEDKILTIRAYINSVGEEAAYNNLISQLDIRYGYT